MPNQRITAPLRSRHALNAITGGSRIKERNSVALPEVDLVHETDMIRRGQAEVLGNNRWQVNERVYVREDSDAGRLFPESGPGIVRLSRAEFRALTILAKYNGYTEPAVRELDRAPDISHDEIATAVQLFSMRSEA